MSVSASAQKREMSVMLSGLAGPGVNRPIIRIWQHDLVMNACFQPPLIRFKRGPGVADGGDRLFKGLRDAARRSP
ncbi:MAG: hypothetical protein OXL68_03620 [Paracoccaceae bacterium]|nr:hypothetical protein [Paracoccaceae bacterium]